MKDKLKELLKENKMSKSIKVTAKCHTKVKEFCKEHNYKIGGFISSAIDEKLKEFPLPDVFIDEYGRENISREEAHRRGYTWAKARLTLDNLI